jgi:DNA-binding IclR family transcriptional regulator
MARTAQNGSATERSLNILEEIAAADRPVGLVELGRRIPLPKPTLHRLVRTLEQQGYISKDVDGRSLVPGPRLTAMAFQVIRGKAAASARRVVLEKLAAAVGETCNLVVLDGHRILYLDRVEAAWPLRLSFQIGEHVPLHCTATGKLLLALQPARERRRLLEHLSLEPLTPATITDAAVLEEELKHIRRQGYGTDQEEFISGMVAISAPIQPAHGTPVAAVSIHAPKLRRSLTELEGFLPQLRAAAARLASTWENTPPEDEAGDPPPNQRTTLLSSVRGRKVSDDEDATDVHGRVQA